MSNNLIKPVSATTMLSSNTYHKTDYINNNKKPNNSDKSVSFKEILERKLK